MCAPIVSCSHALRYHLRYGGGKAGGGYHKKTGVIGIDYLIVAHAYGAYGVIEGYAEYRTYYLYQQSGYAGAEFAVYAAEDIYTNDYQKDENGERTKYYSEGDLVATLVTDENGKAVLSDIPLGTYRVVETKAPYGYVLNKEEQTVTFAYVDDRTPVIKESMTFENDRQKVDLSVLKLDEETELAIAGAGPAPPLLQKRPRSTSGRKR